MVKNKKSNFIWNMLKFVLFIIILYTVFLLPNEFEYLPLFGTLILVISVINIIYYFNNNKISLLIGIISIISICYAMSVCFNSYDTVYNWQIPLVNISNNIINVKNYLLFITLFSYSIGNINSTTKKDLNSFYKNNIIIFSVGYIILFLILLFCFNRGIDVNYSSNTNALYEYAIVIFIFCWIYSGNNKLSKGLLLMYAFLYILNGFIYGDRSSSFPMILAILLFLFNNKITMKYVIVFGVIGILLGNTIDILRNNNYTFNKSVIKEVSNRAFFVNTISYSHYAGTQIINFRDTTNNNLKHFKDYTISYILGGTKKHDLAQKSKNNGFFNRGGGISSTYYYYWFGYIGTIIFAIIMGVIIKKIFSSELEISLILSYVITIFSLRWFLYFPVAFFRTAIIVPLVCYLIVNLFDQMSKKQKIKWFT